MPPAQANGSQWATPSEPFGLPGAALADTSGQWDSLIGSVGPVCLVVERTWGAASVGRPGPPLR